MKRFLSIFVLVAIIIDCKPLYADEVFQDFFNHCTYGVVTGMLIGGASLALAEDPGSSLAPIMRGASLGLYAGALVSVYKNWYTSSHPRIEIGKDESGHFMLIPQKEGLSFALRWRI